MKRTLLSILPFVLVALPALAHVGSPNVFFDGRAGNYSISVIIRPPATLPGAAQVSIKLPDHYADAISLLPVLWQAGAEGSPQPISAQRVVGETNLWDSEVWFLRPGSYTVRIDVNGANGIGEAVVPVNVLGMPNQQMKNLLRIGLLIFGAILLLSAVVIVRAIARDSCLPPEAEASQPRRKFAWYAAGITALLLSAGVAAGAIRWRKMDSDYRNFGSQKPEPVIAEIQTDTNKVLLQLRQSEASLQFPSWASLIPDHGKLMHLFVIRESTLDVFAHLHPVRQSERSFSLELPPLPSGGYELYGDITFENGISQTLVTQLSLPEPNGKIQFTPTVVFNPSNDVFCGFGGSEMALAQGGRDPDNSWHVENSRPLVSTTPKPMLPNAVSVSPLMGGYTLVFENAGEVSEGRASSLGFAAFAPDGSEVRLQPYMGMLGHAAVRRNDGSVFAHLHPMGSFSMASQEAFRRREGTDKSPASTAMGLKGPGSRVSFPYQFPAAGRYRIWVQVRLAGRVLTGVYDIEVRAVKT